MERSNTALLNGRNTAEVEADLDSELEALVTQKEKAPLTENQLQPLPVEEETQLEDIKPRQPVEIKLDAFPHHTFRGRVDSISPASGSQFALLPPDNATGNFTKVVQRIPVKVTFDPQSIQGYESRITPGMSAFVSVAQK